jgi:thiamine monophosphate synthase
MEAGARRIVVVRAITEAPDPVATASRLREMLEEVPL